MVLSIRLPALAWLGSAYATTDSAVNDLEVSLMQGLNPVSKVNHRDENSKSISNLLETAGNLLKNGATPDVVEFTRDILQEIASVIYPSIEDAHNIDQQRVTASWNQFGRVITQMEQAMSEIRLLNAEDTERSDEHKTCRDQEADICTTKVNCDYELHGYWLTFLDEEHEMRSLERTIAEHFCAPDVNGTLATFRAVSQTYFANYLEETTSSWNGVNYEQWSHAENVITNNFESHEASTVYNNFVPQCELHFLALDEKTADCNAKQYHLEDVACQRAVAVRSVRTDYTCAWARALEEYEAIVAQVERLEADRKTECHALSVVECLLTRAQQRNGRPCDEVSDEAERERTVCERSTTRNDWLDFNETIRDSGAFDHVSADYDAYDRNAQELDHFNVTASRHGQGHDCDWLDITYPPVPPYPPPPTPPSYPCSPAFVQQEYGNLPAVPQPVFHHENSHCNQRPDCQACPAMDEPEETCAMPASAAPVLWTQHLGDAMKCNDNVDLQTVANQAACQLAAVAAGHAYYSFRHNPEGNGLHKCMSSESCDSPLTGRNNEWNMYAAFTLAQTDMKCPHQSGDRLFRNPASGSSGITLEQCRAECLITAGCAHFSHGEHGGAYVCMGCTTLVNAQVHAGFNAYDMA